MKKLLLIWMAVAVLLSVCSCKKDYGPMNQQYIAEEPQEGYPFIGGETANTIKVVSYNIRCANDSNGNTIKERAPRLEEVINQYDPDVMGFQEFVPEWNDYVNLAFYDTYDYIINYRCKDNYEGTPVFWKREKFKLLDSGMFWLSETPDQESLGWDADYYRVCSWLKLEVRATGEVFYYYNTHFDYTEPPQEPSAKLMAQRVVTDAPVIITGDFNMEYDSKGYAAMVETFTDANTAKDPTPTFSNYGQLENPTLIDYIFVKNATAQNYKVMTEMPDGKYVSDHFGVYSEVIIK